MSAGGGGWVVHQLMRMLVEVAPPGGTVLDPFAGSGSTGVACVTTGRKFVGIELNAHFCEVARDRIREASAHLWAPTGEVGA